MMSKSSSRTVRSAAPSGRPGPVQRLAAPTSSRRAVVAHVEFSDAFKAALQTAIERDPGASRLSGGGGASATSYADSYSNSSRDAGYSRPTEPYRPVAAPVASSSGPMLQILATALVQSRQTLERLQAEEAEIENLIQKERKQVERLEWLLEKVQQDYAYFEQLQKRFESQGSSSNASSSSSSATGQDAYDAYGSSSSSGRDSYSSSGGYGSSGGSSGYGGGYGGGYDRSESPSNGSSGGSRFANYY